MSGGAWLRHYSSGESSMSAAEKWDDDEFIQLMSDAIGKRDFDDDEPVNLSAERQNPVISWDEFAGNFQ
ncbi:hypothetical protein [Klebsiella pneumoniae]|uniref:hypothetical protein n=2 Tax=Klebsiella TaxID=570 RepID=UPI001C6F7C67|nr:hypothetical protein [Klebsiella pneumoniae]